MVTRKTTPDQGVELILGAGTVDSDNPIPVTGLQLPTALADSGGLKVAGVGGNLIKVGSSTSGAGTIWTPATGKKFRIYRLIPFVTNDAARSSAGDFDFILQDGGVTFFSQKVFIFTAAVSAPGWNSMPPVEIDEGYTSTAANNVLAFNCSVGLGTSGNFGLIVVGREV